MTGNENTANIELARTPRSGSLLSLSTFKVLQKFIDLKFFVFVVLLFVVVAWFSLHYKMRELNDTMLLSMSKNEQIKCNVGWTKFESSCYRVYLPKVTWEKAEERCVQQDANLASVHSERENNFVKELAVRKDRSYYWIGGSSQFYRDFTFVWSDHTPWDYTNSTRPSRSNSKNSTKCMKLVTRYAYENRIEQFWINSACDNQHAFICKLKRE